MRSPLFLARAVYRRRRLRDAARLLPLVGLFLWILPAFGRQSPQEGGKAVYLFITWALLILCAAVLAPGLARPESDSLPAPQEDETDAV